jgi:RNA polymerase sigma-70 factor (ECF subfamily)
VQEVFLEAVRGLAQLEAHAAVKGWLATVTVRVVGRKLRRRRLRGFLGLDARPDYREVASPDAPPDVRALLSRVYRVLDGLAVKERLPWTLRFVEGQELEEVARSCGCSLATVKRRIAAAQAKLERALDDG